MKSIHYFLKHLENLALPHYLAKGQTKSHCARSVCMSHPQAEIESNNYATSLGLRHEEETVQTNLATDPKLSTLRNLGILQPWFCDRLAKSKTIVNFGKTVYQDTMHALTPTEYCFLCRKKQIILSQTNFSKKDRCQRRFQADFTPPSFRTHLLGACAKFCRYACEFRLQNRSFVGFQGIPPWKTPNGEASTRTPEARTGRPSATQQACCRKPGSTDYTEALKLREEKGCGSTRLTCK